jgi:hypothetical protein
MTKNAKPAAIMGSLVNLKNVATHKSLALTIHVPAEAAQEVLAAFGWPTMVDPVPVAVARLEEVAAQAKEGTGAERPPARPHINAVRHWPDLSPAEQTGVIRNEPDFWQFAGVGNAGLARTYIRQQCGVKSCADILPGTEAAAKWAQLQVRYGNWLRKHRGAA